MPLARANNVNAIGGRKVCSLAWTLTTTMREKSSPFGQMLQNNSHWLVQAWTIAQDTCDLLSSHGFSLFPAGCPLPRYRVALQPTTLAGTIFTLLQLKDSTNNSCLSVCDRQRIVTSILLQLATFLVHALFSLLLMFSHFSPFFGFVIKMSFLALKKNDIQMNC